MVFHVPRLDRAATADSGRRTITVGDRAVSAALAPLSADDAARYRATHEIYVRGDVTVKAGTRIDFDGATYRIIAVTDPKAGNPDMKGRYRRLICAAV